MYVSPRVAPAWLALLAVSAAFVAAAGPIVAAAPAADHPGGVAPELLRYERSFNDVRDALAAGEAEKDPAPSAPWPSAELPPPRGLTREVPAATFVATVAHATPGSWREPGDTCTMDAAGVVRVLGSMPGSGSLVEYSAPRAATAGAASTCGNRTIAFVPTGSLFAWPRVGSLLELRRETGARLAAAADRVLSGAGSD